MARNPKSKPSIAGTDATLRQKGARKGSERASEPVLEFRRLVELFRYPRGSTKPTALTNFTFFAGAGFSKSWDPAAPIGSELFTFDTDLLDDVIDPNVLTRAFGVSTDELKPDDIRQITYQLDMYERYPDIRSRYIDDQNTAMIRAALRAAVVDRYASFSGLNYFDPSLSKFPLAATRDQGAILAMFAHLHRCIDGSQFFAEGIRTNFVTTNYDYVIETILDNLIAPDDSLFLYTYRGFTPLSISGYGNPKPTQEHWIGSHLIKLNGGFEILPQNKGYALDYAHRTKAEIRAEPPVLMLPSREQDYSDPYFTAIFPKAVRLMRDTQILVLVGYSLPEDDALMRFVIRQFAEEPEDGRAKVIFYIDPKLGAVKMRKKLAEVFPSMSIYRVPKVVTFEGSLVEFARQYVSLIDKSDRGILD